MLNVKEEYKELSKYRIERAQHDLEAANRNFNEGDYFTANNQ